jgi:hypothetical protein
VLIGLVIFTALRNSFKRADSGSAGGTGGHHDSDGGGDGDGGGGGD